MAAKRAAAAQTTTRRHHRGDLHWATSCSTRPSQRAPRTASLAGRGRPPARPPPMLRASARSPASRRTAVASAPGRRAGRGARSRRRAVARGRRACRPSRAASRMRAPGRPCSGSRGRSSSEVPNTPSAQPARWFSSGKLLVVDPVDPVDVGRAIGEEAVELARADDTERDLGREPGRRQDRLEPMERDQLADEERMKVSAGCQPGWKSRSSAPTKQTAKRSPGRPPRLCEVARVLLGVRDDEVGASEREPIDRGGGLRRRASPLRSGHGPRRASRGARRAD